ncbi:MAG: hypothetical protein ACXQTS_02765 [Candidatus Methanospirareceae archaeon]
MMELVKVLKIQKKAKGYFVRIPSEIIPVLRLEEREKVKVYVDKERGRIIYEII